MYQQAIRLFANTNTVALAPAPSLRELALAGLVDFAGAREGDREELADVRARALCAPSVRAVSLRAGGRRSSRCCAPRARCSTSTDGRDMRFPFPVSGVIEHMLFPMRRRYFSVGISVDGAGVASLTHLPRLVDGHVPQMHALPDFVLLLAWKVRGVCLCVCVSVCVCV